MHSVSRTAIPSSLKVNGDQWTKELLQQLNIYKEFKDIPIKYTDKYRQEDVKNALCNMYQKRCCYCEGRIGAQTYEHIEHLKPKSIFPQETFQWSNLHWVCPICNSSYKKAKWDRENPILDPTKDKIEDYIDIDLTTGEIITKNNSLRADVTIEHTGLNRDKLIDERRAVIKKINGLVTLATGQKSKLIDYLNMIKEDSAYLTIYNKYIERLSMS